jgi:MFS family permease
VNTSGNDIPENELDTPVVPLGESTAHTPDHDRPSPAETRKALWVAAIAWGVFGSAFSNLVSGAPFVSFTRLLGASTFMFGLLSSLPFLGVLAQLAASYYVETRRRRRRFFLVIASIQRLSWLLVAALPWIIPSHHGNMRIYVLLVLMIVSAALGHAASPAWNSWFADMVPERIRGRYLGNRAALATVTGVIVSALVGWIVDRNSGYVVFTIIFCVAAILGVCDIWSFFLIKERPMPPHEGPPWRLRDVVAEPLRDRKFRGYLLYAMSEAITFGIAGPFFWLLALEHLKIGNLWSNIYIMTGPMIFCGLSLPFWGSLCDRFGSKSLAALGTLVSIIYPVAWLLATPHTYHPILIVTAVIGGISSAAVQMADLNMVFALTPRESRSAYLAMLSVAAGIGWVIAPSLSGALADILKPVHIVVAGQGFTSLHILMVISALARLCHVLFIVPHLPEQPKQGMRGLIRHLVKRPMEIAGGVVKGKWER